LSDAFISMSLHKRGKYPGGNQWPWCLQCGISSCRRVYACSYVWGLYSIPCRAL